MKRALIAILCIFALLISGCASAPAEEEGAVNDVVVENESDHTGNTEKGKPQTVPDQPEVSVDQDGPSEEQPEEENEPAQEKPEQEPEKQEPEEKEEDVQITEDKESNLTLMAFNIRNYGDANGHSREERRPRIKTIMDLYTPDVVGLVEMKKQWVIYLEEDYPQYDMTVHYRNLNIDDPEGLAILYKTSAVELLEEDFFWLSQTPDKESMGWDAKYYRICTWARFKHKATGKIFVYYNVHLDGTDACTTGSYQLIHREILKNSKYPCFIGGDCNMRPGSLGHITFTTTMDEARTVLSSPTSDSLSRTYPLGYPNIKEHDNRAENGIIDYIFHQEDKAEAIDYIVHQGLIDGGYASDHYPIICKYII